MPINSAVPGATNANKTLVEAKLNIIADLYDLNPRIPGIRTFPDLVPAKSRYGIDKLTYIYDVICNLESEPFFNITDHFDFYQQMIEKCLILKITNFITHRNGPQKDDFEKRLDMVRTKFIEAQNQRRDQLLEALATADEGQMIMESRFQRKGKNKSDINP